MKTNLDQKTSLAENKEPVRLLALSDGVFATVFTLLVLDLRLPSALNASGGSIHAFIKYIGPHLFSYLLTFQVGGTYWLAHHRNFDYIPRYDRGLLSYNLLFLLFIGLLPFTTANISGTGGSFQSINFSFYWSIYAVNMVLAGVMLGLTWAYAISHQLVSTEMTPGQKRYISLRLWITPSAFIVSILMEVLFPQAFLGPYTLLIIPLVLWLADWKFGQVNMHKPPLTWKEYLWRAGRILPWVLMIGLAIWASTV